MVKIIISTLSLSLCLLSSLPSASALCATVDQSKDQIGTATGQNMGGHMDIKVEDDAASKLGVGTGMYQPGRMFKGSYPTLEEILNPTVKELKTSLENEQKNEKLTGQHFESYGSMSM